MDMGDHDMGGMDMGGDDGGAACVISMLWNWNTIDSCFLSSQWHIRSRGMFAGSCIGVILLVIALEFLRRVAREYDSFLVRDAQRKSQYQSRSQFHEPNLAASAAESSSSTDHGKAPASTTTVTGAAAAAAAAVQGSGGGVSVRPTLVQQVLRAFLHMLQFAVAYFVMLLAMYFNGYIIICIFIGAFLGSFIFSWEVLGAGAKENDATAVTKCCG
ncbi:Ctr copper transporter family-domain-containing protein [Aspergillus carlsbadensis]|nr:Ctr copper transporter family-domain-containing protein [Aspergillus carlsbadensis]